MANANTIKTDRNRTRQLGGRTAYNRYRKVCYKGKKWLMGENLFGMCAGCKVQFPREKLTLDHKIAIRFGGAMGGPNELENLQLLCKPCHVEKNKKETLLATPQE